MEKVLRVEDGKYVSGEMISGETELTHLLWTNPSPTAAFEAQTISLDLSKYDYIEVYYYSAGGEGDGLLYAKSSVPGDIELISLNGNTNSAIGTVGRKRNGTVSATGIVFGNGEQVYTGKAIYTVNTANVPVYIYGITNKIQTIATDVATTADKCMMSDGVTSVEDSINGLKIKTGSVSGTTGGNGILLSDLNVNDIVIVSAHMTGTIVNPLEYPSGKYAFELWGVTTAGVFTPSRNVAVTVYYDYIERPSAT